MMKIGIIGASSQVGSSLAFYLQHFTAAAPVCFIRSSYSAVFFEICGLPYEVVDVNDITALQQSFAQLDGVIDCSYPSGQLYEIPAIIEQQLTNIISALPANAFFIYMSTIMAFGMPTGYARVKHFSIPQTTYAFIKRKAEKHTSTLCTRNGIRGYNFRLGQVHGFLQSVNTSYREKLRNNTTVLLHGKASDPVNILFISTLGEAIIKAAKAQIAPGLYSLVNSPQWSLQQLYEFYFSYYGYSNTIRYVNTGNNGSTLGITGMITRLRPLIESYLLMKRPALYKKVKGRYRVQEAGKPAAVPQDTYTDFHLTGINPGKIVEGLNGTPAYVFACEKAMEQLYHDLVEQSQKKDAVL